MLGVAREGPGADVKLHVVFGLCFDSFLSSQGFQNFHLENHPFRPKIRRFIPIFNLNSPISRGFFAWKPWLETELEHVEAWIAKISTFVTPLCEESSHVKSSSQGCKH